VADIELEVQARVGGAVHLGRPSGSGRLPMADLEITPADELVEMMAGNVGVEPCGLGHIAGGQTSVVFVDQEVDVSPGRITERRRDGVHQIGEFRRVEGSLGHVGSLTPVALTEELVIETLRPVQDPELHRSIVDLGMVRRVDLAPPQVTVAVDLTIAGCPLRNEINRSVTDAVQALDGVDEVVVEFGVMTDEQREAVRRQVHGDPGASAGSQQAHGHAEGRAIPFADADNRTRVILVASGKGGVGKSSVTTNLAVALAARKKSGKSAEAGANNANNTNNRVAIVDADVWGFSIPRMLGVDRDPVVIDEMIVPPEVHGVRCISMGFFVEENQPVIWRGPMLHKALEQFLTDVYWDDPDYLLVDLPPGTGDIALSLAQFLPRSELLVVTTPQPAAQKVAQRAAYMAHKVHITVSGVIENMSWFTGDDGKRYELFGAGGGQELANDLEVPLLAQLPLIPALREGADTGHPIAADAATEAGAAFAQLAERVDVELAPKKRFRSELKIV